jgi:hypothetical protein
MKLRPTLFSRLLPAVAAVAFILASSEAAAHSTGITGFSTAGCTCHTPVPSSATSLSLTSSTGQLAVEPGGTITLTLAVAHASMQAAGVNIAVSQGGTLGVVAGQGLRLESRELTHTTPKAMSGGSASFTFTWTAPSTPGTYTLTAAGNAVNRNGNSIGDAFNLLSQAITVGPVTDVADNETGAPVPALSSVGVFPNPVPVSNGFVEVRYRMESRRMITIELYDTKGTVVYTEQYYGETGDHTALLDTRNLAAGVYFAAVRAGNERIVRHITVVK